MVYGIYQSAGGMMLNQYRHSVLANNLANLDTAGFKHDLTVVRERKVQSREGLEGSSLSDQVLDRMTGGSLVAPTVTSFEQGMIQDTGGKLDAAIDGDGFFTVSDGARVRYTRDGRFTLNKEGTLVTTGGKPVLDGQGQQIQVPSEARSRARIDGDGSIRAGEAVFGRVGVAEFTDRSLLSKAGGNLFDSLGTKAEAATPRLRTGAIESSTVDPTKSMVAMIEVARAYELNASMVSMADTTLSRAVNDIGRIR